MPDLRGSFNYLFANSTTVAPEITTIVPLVSCNTYDNDIQNIDKAPITNIIICD